MHGRKSQLLQANFKPSIERTRFGQWSSNRYEVVFANLQQALFREYVFVVRDEGHVVPLCLWEVLRPPVPVEQEGAVRRYPKFFRVRLLAMKLNT